MEGCGEEEKFSQNEQSTRLVCKHMCSTKSSIDIHDVARRGEKIARHLNVRQRLAENSRTSQRGMAAHRNVLQGKSLTCPHEDDYSPAEAFISLHTVSLTVGSAFFFFVARLITSLSFMTFRRFYLCHFATF